MREWASLGTDHTSWLRGCCFVDSATKTSAGRLRIIELVDARRYGFVAGAALLCVSI